MNNNIFKRYELKYLLDAAQYKAVRDGMEKFMRGDKYGESDICNLYCDTPSFILARRSIERPIYKEKLRIRSYGIAKEGSEIFVEIKKKYQSIVYKRRICTDEQTAMSLLGGGATIDTQIGREIGYFKKLYEGIAPKVYISYRREAFYAKDDNDFRMTFDKDILWRDHDVLLSSGIYGQPVLPNGKILLEVKTAAAIPLWLVKILSANKIFKTSFSKYGTAYELISQKTAQGGKEVA